MTFDEAVKIYTRFLKEHGVFKRAIEIHKYGARERETTFEASLRKCDYWYNWLQDDYCFCLWRYTKERDEFWWALSILWQIMCVYKDITGVINVNKKIRIQECINSIDRYNEWFAHRVHLGLSCVDEKTIEGLKSKIDKLKEELKNLKI